MPRGGRQSERTCIVSRRTGPVDGLIRFVAAPDGEVVADLRGRLPGRGVWVTADAEHVRAAEKKRLFQRGLGPEASVAPGLAERIAAQLRQAAVASLSMARKAGTAVTGSAKVEAALGKGSVVALIHASEAADDGVAKLASAARRHAGPHAPEVVRLFDGEELDLAFGRSNVIHAALLVGPASTNVLKRVRAFADFVGGGKGVGRAESDLARPADMSVRS